MVLAQVPGIQHGFGDRNHPEPIGAVLPQWTQVHGIQIGHWSGREPDLGEVDGMWTSTAFASVAVRTADCVPILMARTDGTAIAALHAGWRGSLAGIGGAFFASSFEAPEAWVAAIGPCAGSCCYEVSLDLAERFAAKVPASVQGRNVDLATFNAVQLGQLGVQKIDVLGVCTICGRNGPDFAFNSFRREKTTDRQVSWLTLS